MKLTFEIHGYTITIDETEEGIAVSASQDDEVVEEFTLDLTEGGDDDMDIEDDSMEEIEGMEGQALPQGQPQGQPEEFAQGQPQGQLESFSSFIKKRA
jgi:hypothetical protein